MKDLEAELALYKIPQPEKSADKTLVRSSAGRESPDTTLTNHIETQSPLADMDLDDNSLQGQFGSFTFDKKLYVNLDCYISKTATLTQFNFISAKFHCQNSVVGQTNCTQLAMIE